MSAMKSKLARNLFLTALLFSCVVLTACSGGDAEAPAEAATTEAQTPAATPEAPAAAPAGDFAPVSSREGSPALGDETLAVLGAVFTLPASWQSEAPSSSMRVAQMNIPGDAGNGQLGVFHFGPGGGGGVEANLQRWVGQIELDAGTQPSRDTFTVGDFKVHWVDVKGTLKPSTMGMGNANALPGYALYGAVVEGNQGPWFFKATGPAATLEAHRDSFVAMLKSVRAQEAPAAI